MILYFMTGSLPWIPIDNMEMSERRRFLEIKKCKESTPVEELCKGLPRCFFEYMKYCRNLEFDADPDYKYLRTLFDDHYDDCKYEPVDPATAKLDWHYQKEKILAEKIKHEEEEKERAFQKTQKKDRKQSLK